MGNTRGLLDPQQRSPFPYFHTLVKSDGAPSIQLGGPALQLFLQKKPLGSPSLPLTGQLSGDAPVQWLLSKVTLCGTRLGDQFPLP